MAWDVIMAEPAIAQVKRLPAFHRSRIVDSIEQGLRHEPNVPTRNRKPLPDNVRPIFEFQPPLWELRVGAYRIFYDLEEPANVVHVRAVLLKDGGKTTEEIVS